MKKVTIHVQKCIMFIPVVNFLNLFIWWYNNYIEYRGRNLVNRTMFILITSVLPLYVVSLLTADVTPVAADILGRINVYIGPLIMGHRLIKLQEELDNLHKDA